MLGDVTGAKKSVTKSAQSLLVLVDNDLGKTHTRGNKLTGTTADRKFCWEKY